MWEIIPAKLVVLLNLNEAEPRGAVMNCTDAQKIWNHQGGFLMGMACKGHGYQEVIPFLTQIALNFTKNISNVFDAAVKEKAGKGNYLVTHSDGVSDLALKVHDVVGDKVACRIVSETIAKIVGVPTLTFSNICCNGCNVSDGSLTPDQELAIQMASVNTNPDGTPVI